MFTAHCFLLASSCWESAADVYGWVWGAFAPPACSSASSQDAAARTAVLQQCITWEKLAAKQGRFFNLPVITLIDQSHKTAVNSSLFPLQTRERMQESVKWIQCGDTPCPTVQSLHYASAQEPHVPQETEKPVLPFWKPAATTHLHPSHLPSFLLWIQV